MSLVQLQGLNYFINTVLDYVEASALAKIYIHRRLTR